MNPERNHFGARLRQQREARSLTVPDIVKTTKIPERSVQHLEHGLFDELPGEVYTRGFLKSYCKAVGLDAEQVLVEYHELIAPGAPKRPPSLARLASAERPAEPTPARTAEPAAKDGKDARDGKDGKDAKDGKDGNDKKDAAPNDAKGDKESTEKDEKKEEPSIFTVLANAGRSTSRASLTIAVVILVVVATVALSLLLRRPGHVSDGVSRADVEVTITG
jgi:hypothetical protein